MAVEKNLISGSTSMLLLGLLQEKDMYGYEMITKEGKRHLARRKQEWQEYAQAVRDVLCPEV